MNITTIALSGINPAEYNPRIITKDEFDGLKTSLKTYGQQENLIVNKDMTLISGHQRLQAMHALGWTEAVCNVVDLDKHEEMKLNVIMNSQAISGTWDDLKLSEILEELKLDDNYESLRLNELEPLDLSPTEVEEDEAPEVSQEPPVSKLGEIYQLGRHRVMCGDSTDKASVELLMNGAKADMVFTDPPYGNANAAHYGRGELGHRHILGDEDFTTTELALRNHLDIPQLFFLQWRTFKEAIAYLEGTGKGLKTVAVWDKKNSALGQGMAEQWEAILISADVKYKKFGGNVFRVSREQKTRVNSPHPHQKPIELLADLFKFFEADSYIDPFLGSGSTLIACEQTDRTCYGMELDPKYVDVIRKRYWKFINDGNEEGWEDGTTNSND